jgi:serine/threonine-protein kinase
MSKIRLQSDTERSRGIYYEFDSSDIPLGKGGTGTVYRGLCVYEKTGQSQTVAVKFMYEGLPLDVIERARREASIWIKNENLVEMLGFIELEEKGYFKGETIKRYHVVSEYLEGVMLDDLLQGKTTSHDGTEVPYAQELYKLYINDSFHFALLVVRNILSGLMALHDAGYIHRDIDPTNIMITCDRHIKLIDFGIAKQLSMLNTQDRGLTNSGQFIGKPQYASPELVLGDVKHQNETTDIYAVGIVLFQFIVGHLPFEGPDHEVLQMQIKKPVPLNLVKQRTVRRVIAKATSKKQEQRYQSAAEFRVALDALKDLGYSDRNQLPFLYKVLKNKKVWYCITGTAAVLGLLILRGNLPKESIISKRETIVVPVFPPHKETKQVFAYDQAVKLLATTITAQQGLLLLDSLHRSGNYKATFLLSRLYFNKSGEYALQEVKRMKKSLSIGCDNRKAHKLLEEAVSMNGDDYKSLYELGSDYLAGDIRTNIGNSRKLLKSYHLLSKAYAKAKENRDGLYERLIKTQLNKIPGKYK